MKEKKSLCNVSVKNELQQDLQFSLLWLLFFILFREYLHFFERYSLIRYFIVIEQPWNFMLKIFLGHNAIILLFLKLKSIRPITDAIGLLVPCWMYSAFLQRQPCLSGAFLHSLLQWARLITDCCLWTEAPFISFFSTSFPPFHTALSTD